MSSLPVPTRRLPVPAPADPADLRVHAPAAPVPPPAAPTPPMKARQKSISGEGRGRSQVRQKSFSAGSSNTAVDPDYPFHNNALSLSRQDHQPPPPPLVLPEWNSTKVVTVKPASQALRKSKSYAKSLRKDHNGNVITDDDSTSTGGGTSYSSSASSRALAARVAELENQLEFAQMELENMQSRLDETSVDHASQLRDMKHDMEKLAEEKDRELRSVSEKFSVEKNLLTADIDSLRAVNDMKLNEIAKLHQIGIQTAQSIAVKDVEVVKLSAEVQLAQSKSAMLHDEILRLQQQVKNDAQDRINKEIELKASLEDSNNSLQGLKQRIAAEKGEYERSMQNLMTNHESEIGRLKSEFTDLKAKDASNESQIASLKAQLSDSLAENEKLREFISTLSSKLALTNAEITSLKSKASSAESQLTAATTRSEALETDNNELRESLERAVKERDMSSLEISAFKSKNATLEAQMDSAKGYFDALQAENRNLATSLADTTAKNTALTDELASAGTRHSAKEAEAASLRAQVASLRLDCEGLREALKQATVQRDAFEADIVAWKSKDSTNDAQVAALKSVVSSLQADNEKQRSMLEVGVARMREMDDELASWRTRDSANATKIESLESAATSLRAEKENVNELLMKITAQNEGLFENVHEKESIIEKLSDDIDYLRKELDESKSKEASLESRLGASVKSLELAKADFTIKSKSYEDTIEILHNSLESNASETNTNVAKLNSDITVLNSQLSESKAAQASLKDSLTKARAEIDAYTSALIEKDSLVASLRQASDLLTKDVKTAVANEAAVAETLRISRRELDTLKVEMASRIAAHETDVKSWQSKLEALEREKSAMISKLNNEIASYTKEIVESRTNEASMKNSLIQVTAQKDNLQSELNQKDVVVVNLTEKSQTQGKELAENSAQISKLSASLDEKSRMLEAAKAELAAKVASYDATVENLQTSLASSGTEKDELLVQLNEELSAMVIIFDEQASQIEELKASESRLKSAIAGASSEKEQVNANLKEKESAISELSKKCEKLEKELEESLGKQASLLQRLDASRDEFEAFKNAQASKDLAHNELVQVLKSTAESNDVEKEAFIEKLYAEIAARTQEIEEYKTREVSLKNSLSKAVSASDSSAEKMHELESSNSRAGREKDSLIVKLNADINSQKKQLDASLASESSLKAAVEDLTKKLENSEVQLSVEAFNRSEALHSLEANHKQETSSLRSEIVHLQQRMSIVANSDTFSLQETIASLREENESLSARTKIQEGVITKLNQDAVKMVEFPSVCGEVVLIAIVQQKRLDIVERNLDLARNSSRRRALPERSGSLHATQELEKSIEDGLTPSRVRSPLSSRPTSISPMPFPFADKSSPMSTLERPMANSAVRPWTETPPIPVTRMAETDRTKSPIIEMISDIDKAFGL
ncbi:hypothetical protein HDU83_000827 [Entophlyctis luteolus]|nr:hypothetical protein HDU83_000827 [Entophlyctis luteolus]